MVCIFGREHVYCVDMFSGGLIYFPGESVVHRCDARLKLVVLLVFSIALFFAKSWWGMGGAVALVAIAAAVARVPMGLFNRMLVPVYVLAGFSVLFNVIGTPGLEGLVRGLFFGVRMVVLVAASFVVCLTTSSAELLDAFQKLISPLRRLRVPVDDIAMTLALSVRFIPVIEREFASIRAAQIARGAETAGSLSQKLRVWGAAFAALFVGLFRHADALARAMDARCYGASSARTRLSK